MAKLNADPEWVARRKQQEVELLKSTEELRRVQTPLLKELHAAGYEVESVWDLVNTTAPYKEVLPILLEHLQRNYPAPIRDGIARALAVRDAKFGWGVIVRQFRDEHDERVKQGLGAALAVIADDTEINEVIALIRDKHHGESRAFLVAVLGRSSDPRAKTVLLELADEPQLATEIRRVLRQRARPKRRAHKQ